MITNSKTFFCLIRTLNKKFFLWSGPHSKHKSYCGAPILCFDAYSPKSDTGCFPCNDNGAFCLLLFCFFFCCSSFATKPFLSNLTSSRSGSNAPFLSFPKPSPGFHPIFCRRCIPIPPETGAAVCS